MLLDASRFGVWPLVAGTALISAIAMAVALPVGLGVALYASEYATAPSRRIVRATLDVLSGVPTVIYGYLALAHVTPWLQSWVPGLSDHNALSPGVVMGVVLVPLVASLSADALSGVPRVSRDTALALGATRRQAVVGLVLPAARHGLLAAMLLGLSRAIGATMVVAVAAGLEPVERAGLLGPAETMSASILHVSRGAAPIGAGTYEAIVGMAMLLLGVTLFLNICGEWLRHRQPGGAA